MTSVEAASLSPSDRGKISPDGVGSVRGAYWEDVLDSIAALREYFEKEADGYDDTQVPLQLVGPLKPGPALIYGGLQGRF